MPDIGDLTGTISLDDEVSDVLSRVEQHLRSLVDNSQTFADEFDTSVTRAAVKGSFLGNILSDMAMKAMSWGKDLVTSSLMAGARLEQLTGVSQFLGERAGYTKQYIEELAREIEHSGIAGIDTRDAIVKLIGANIDLSKAAQLSATAQNMATISGASSTETFSRIVRAITTLNPELLKSAGFTTTVESAVRAYAETTGKSASALTGAQKQQILLNAVLEEGASKAGLYGLSMEYASKQAGSSERAWQQVSEQIGTVLLPITNIAIKSWYQFGTSVRDAVIRSQDELKPFAATIADVMRLIISTTSDAASSVIDAGGTVVNWATTAYQAYNELPRPVRALAEAFVILTAALWAFNAALNAIAASRFAIWLAQAATTVHYWIGLMKAFGVMEVVAMSFKMAAGAVGGFLSALAVPAALIALPFAFKEAWDAVAKFIEVWRSGGDVWAFFTKREEHTFAQEILRWAGLMGPASDQVAKMNGLLRERKALEAGMSSRSAAPLGDLKSELEAQMRQRSVPTPALAMAPDFTAQLDAAHKRIAELTREGSAGFKDLTNGIRSGHFEVKKLEASANALGLSKVGFDILRDSINKTAHEAARNAENMAKQRKEIADNWAAVGHLTDAQKGLVNTHLLVGRSVDDIAKMYRLNEAAVKAYADELKVLDDRLRSITTSGAKDLPSQLGIRSNDILLYRAFNAEQDKTRDIWLGIKGLEMDTEFKNEAAAIEDIRASAVRVGPTLDMLKGRFKDLRDQLMTDLKNVPQTIVNALTGGGGMRGAAQAIGSQFGNTFGQMFGRTIQGLGSLGGPIFGALGSLAGPLIGKLFEIGGPSRKELAGRDITRQFQESFGGAQKMIGDVARTYELIGRGADQARADIEAMWRAEKQGPEATAAARDKILSAYRELEERTKRIADSVNDVVDAWDNAGTYIPQATRGAIAELAKMKGLTDEQRIALERLVRGPSFADIQQEAEGFGVTLQQLGPAFQGAAIDAETKRIMDFFQRARDAGADVGGVVAGLADEISKVVNDSRRFGQAIPENMKPLIELLAKTGQLTDDQGNKITDISTLSFKDTPLDESLNRLNETIEHLRDVLMSIPGVAQAAANGVPNNPFENWAPPPGWEARANAGAGWDQPTPEPMAEGGFGYASAPRTFTTRGDEWFAFSGEGKSFPLVKPGPVPSAATAAPTRGGGTVIIELDRRVLAEIVVPEIPGAMERFGLGTV